MFSAVRSFLNKDLTSYYILRDVNFRKVNYNLLVFEKILARAGFEPPPYAWGGEETSFEKY